LAVLFERGQLNCQFAVVFCVRKGVVNRRFHFQKFTEEKTSRLCRMEPMGTIGSSGRFGFPNLLSAVRHENSKHHTFGGLRYGNLLQFHSIPGGEKLKLQANFLRVLKKNDGFVMPFTVLNTSLKYNS
jgi:hypothetical protein